MSSGLASLFVLAIAGYVRSHSVGKARRDEECKSGKLFSPQFVEYHFHVLFVRSSQASVKSALNLRQQFETEFGPLRNCTSLYHQAGICKYDVILDPSTDPGTPFTGAQLSWFIPQRQLAEALSWVISHRDPSPEAQISLFVHPNSGCSFEDHFRFALWQGEKWPLNIEPFKLYCEEPGCVDSSSCSTYFDEASCIAEASHQKSQHERCMWLEGKCVGRATPLALHPHDLNITL